MNATSRRLLSLLLLSSLLLSACQSDEAKTAESTPAAEQNAEKQTQIRVLHVRPTSFSNRLELTGNVEPWKTVTLAAEVGGKLEAFNLNEGQTVKQGQALGHVNSRLLSAQKAQAEANYRLTQLQEKWQQQNLNKQVDLAESSYANSASNFSRQKQLYQEQVVSAQTFDSSENTLTNAKLQLELQKIGSRSGAELNQQQTRVAASSLELAKVSLSQASLLSPLSGYVNRIYAEAGEVVSPGSPIAEIVQINPVKLTVGTPERDITSIALGQSVNVRFDALPDTLLTGTVIFIAAVADAESKTFPVKIRLENPNLKIRGGMIGRAELARGRTSDAIVIPQDAVIDEKGGRYVFIEKDGLAKKVSVSLGQRQGTEVVVTSGLKPGDALVTFGHRNLLDTHPVNVQERRYQGAAPLPASPANAQVQPQPAASSSPATEG